MKDRIASFIVDCRKVVLVAMLVVTAIVSLLMLRVTINTDLTKYLPDDSSMKAGLDIMAEELPDSVSAHTLRVMVMGLTDNERSELVGELGNLDHVESVTHTVGDPLYNQGEHALYTIFMDCNYRTAEERGLEADIVSLVGDLYPDAQTEVADDDSNSSDIPLQTLVIALGFLFAILFLMCASWLETLLFLVAIGCAVGINLGSNIVMGQISSVTMCIAALLQLVLSMDYSIILMNRYRQELSQETVPAGADRPDAGQRSSAMKRALGGAFSAITSSSLTTFVGLLALVFMSFKIGADLGIVLAKGVICSLVCVFTVLPALILLSDQGIRATSKPVLNIDRLLGPLATFSSKARFALVAGFVGVFVLAYLGQAAAGTSYTLSREDAIAQVFPRTTNVVVLYENADEDAMAAHIDELESNPLVSSVNAWGNTLGRAYTAEELAEALEEFDTSSLGSGENGHQTEDGSDSAAQSENEPKGSTTAPGGGALAGAFFGNAADSQETSTKDDGGFALDANTINMVFYLYHTGQSLDDMSMVELLKLSRNASAMVDPTWTMTIQELVTYVRDDLLTSERAAGMVDDEQRTAVDDMARQIEDGAGKLRGPEHSIMAITLLGEAGTSKVFGFLGSLDAWCKGNLGEYHLIGDGPMAYEMSLGFKTEYLFITLLTAGAIFLVVAVAFRNLLIPLILVLLVQCGVYLTVLAVGLQGYSIYYLALLMVQCILMGATIDYGILFTSNYRDARRSLGVRDALYQGYTRSIHTILTSGLIIVLVTGVVAMFGVDPTINQICQTISMGAACTIVLIMVFLPGILAACDRWVAPTRV